MVLKSNGYGVRDAGNDGHGVKEVLESNGYGARE
jgi:hypothetical protein